MESINYIPEPEAIEKNVGTDFDAKILELNDVAASLEKYTLGGIEKEKLGEVIDTARTILQDMKAGKKLDAEEIKKKTQDIELELNKISFEGKGVTEEDKEEVSYIKRALISITQTLRNIFSFIGQFMSKESNPVANALFGCSFFISTPTTAREANEIQEDKAKVLDTMISAAA